MSATRTLLVLSVLVSVPVVFGQAPPGRSPAATDTAAGPRLSLSSPIAAPGERAVVAIRPEETGELPVHGLKLDVLFPASLLTFVEARPAFHQKLTIKSSVAGPDAATGTARLSLAASADHPLAAGDAVELVFQVSNTVYTDQDAPVAGASASLAGANGQPLREVAVKDGKVSISVASVVFGCFFYMH